MQLNFFSLSFLKENPFFPVGRPRSRPLPKAQPLQVPFPLLNRVLLRHQKGGFGEEHCLRRSGVDREKKRKKGCAKKAGAVFLEGCTLNLAQVNFTPPISSRMRLFCLQLEASRLQWSFFAYSCVWELFTYSFSVFAYNWSLFACNGKCF